MENKLYVQYGCGLTAPAHWLNFDSSPTLIIQRTPVLGMLLKNKLNCNFPDAVRFGDIVKGLPVKDNSCNGVFCSHVLEHLSLTDFKTALKNTYRILKPGGIFRCVVPDLESYARTYIDSLEKGNASASIDFIKTSILGVAEKPKGIKGLATALFGNAHHLWMWDHTSLAEELRKVLFKEVKKCSFNDSSDGMFSLVEDKNRFDQAVALQCVK